MLINALKEQFEHNLLEKAFALWFDGEQDYHSILDGLRTPGMQLRIVLSSGELIHLRADLQALPPGEKLVIYLPFSQDDPAIDILTPLIPLAATFNDSLLRFLSQQGVEFPEDPKTRSVIKDVLPRLALQ